MCKAAKEELLSIAEEIAFAKALAANDKSLRDRALKKLRKWFITKSTQTTNEMRFTEEGFMRIWKGLFYCVWMSDKPLIQEECVENVSSLIHCFGDSEDARKFLRCFFQSIAQSWLGLDGHRIDKYLMLVRRFLRHIFQYLDNISWKEEIVDAVASDLFKALQHSPVGFNLHLIEIYLDELAKVGRGELDPKIVLQTIKPFADFMAISTDTRVLRYVQDFLFFHLLRQSDEGIKYAAKFEVWKQLGFPEGDIDVIQEASDEEFEKDDDSDMEADPSEGGPLDPRAGNVDVLLPPINFDARAIREYLQNLAKKKDTTTKARKSICFITKKYDKYIDGMYPLGIRKCEVPETENMEEIIEAKAEELFKEDKAFAMERKQFKKQRKAVVLNGWEVTPVKEANLSGVDEDYSNRGQWEVRNSMKRKKQSKKVCSTMKKIKITLDDSLLNLSLSDKTEPEGLSQSFESLELETVNISSSDTSGRRNQNTNLKRKKTDERENSDMNPFKKEKYKSLLGTMKHFEDMMKKRQDDKKQKIELAQKEWGLTNEWDISSKEEEIVLQLSPNETIKNTKTSKTPMGKMTPLQKSTPLTSKKVEFNLSGNKSQDIKEYQKVLRESPKIPFDHQKQPLQGVLKSKSIGSPINPFYYVENLQ